MPERRRCEGFQLGAVSAELTPEWGLSSAGRAPALQAGGRRFDPDRLHHRRTARFGGGGLAVERSDMPSSKEEEKVCSLVELWLLSVCLFC